MDACWHVPSIGEKTSHSARLSPIPILNSTARVRQGWGRSISTPGTMRIWDTQTGVVVNDIDIDDFGEIAFCGTQSTIILVMGGGFRTYNGLTGTQLCEGELLPSYNHQLVAHWDRGGALQFARSFRVDGQLTIDICELQPASNSTPPVVKSFPVSPHGGIFSFSPASSHASCVTETEVVILDVQDSQVLLQTKATCPLYTPSGRFSPDGSFFACGTLGNEICVWENTPAGYIPWSNLRPLLPSIGFALSPVGTSVLSWGSQGIELLHLGNPAGGACIAATQREDIGVERMVIVDPGETRFLPSIATRSRLASRTAHGAHVSPRSKGRTPT
jgi:WD40 repeat protein